MSRWRFTQIFRTLVFASSLLAATSLSHAQSESGGSAQPSDSSAASSAEAATSAPGKKSETKPGETETKQAAEQADQSPSAEAAVEEPNWEKRIDNFFQDRLVTPLGNALFYPIYTTTDSDGNATDIPFVVVWLTLGATFFTVFMGFISLRGFRHSVDVTRGKYDDPNDIGEVTHFQALASALSATIGLGNIAGVAIAVGTGGPGAIFWMIIAGLIGMSSKFTECTLAQMYRKVEPDGTISGGPMRYLKDGLKEMGLGPVGVILSLIFAILCIGGSLGGGCAFQVVQSLGVLKEQIPILKSDSWIYGIIMVVMVGIVIIGGIRRIASTAEKIVPAMCVIYCVTALIILGMNFDKIPWAIGQILEGAFTGGAIKGGVIGVMVIGIKRAAFSNEAGVGSAAIAHSAAKTNYPIREGMVALLGPFIDTVVICTMTGLVIVITQAYDTSIYPDNQAFIDTNQGAQLTSVAFASVISWFPWVLAIASTLFAYSTMISWSYYGERCVNFLFGRRASLPYKILYLVFVMLGSIVSATAILDFSDLMILTMAVPNVLGCILLAPKVKAKLNVYWAEYKAGEFKVFK